MKKRTGLVFTKGDSKMVSATGRSKVTESEDVFLEHIVMPKSAKPVVFSMVIDRTMATLMLERNTANRKASALHVNALGRETTEDRWVFNGEPIKFARDGRLIDGQHRLMAVAKTGIPIETFVVFGLSPDAFATYNGSKRRSNSDVLSILGEVNTHRLASALSNVACYDAGRTGEFGHSRVPGTAMEELLAKYPGVRDSVRIFSKDTKRLMPPSLMASLHYIFGRIDEDAASEYCNSIIDGVGLQVGDPAHTVREKLMANAATRGAKIPTVMIAAFVIKGWNAFREGRKLRVLKFLAGEEFPRSK
jgi:hypothetical protein